jgi:hypothetical protein
LFFDSEDGGDVVLCNVGLFPDHTASQLRSLYTSSILADYRLSGLFPFRIIDVGKTPWMGDQPVARPLPTQDSTNTE